MKKIAFIPARSGSKRIKDKNIYQLNGAPLIAYSIISAIKSNIFDDVVCATDSKEYADIAISYGASVPFLREENSSGDHSPDIAWLKYMLLGLEYKRMTYDYFSILRPTSPFRTAETIKRAWRKFTAFEHRCDSLRAVELCSQHPGKMWSLVDDYLLPIMPFSINTGVGDDMTPMHSSQYASLPKVFVQNASLEISKTINIFEKNSISGVNILGFKTKDYEGFDINYPIDLMIAEQLISSKSIILDKN